jgi:small-conductance mechanosensitive channel
MKYTVRKSFSIVFLVGALAAVSVLWAADTQGLMIFMGLLAAGIAIALQDVFKSFVGGIMIFTNGIYRVGDRIEMAGKTGDVLDIGVLSTTVLELREWVAAEQPSGRISNIPNSLVLTSVVNNYSKDHNFIWDEVTIPLTYDSDWRLARTRFLRMVTKVTGATSRKAEKDIAKLEEKYYLPRRPTEPAVFITPTDNWITMQIRYTTEVRARRQINTDIHRRILEIVEGSGGKIKLASATFEIVGFPPVRVESGGKAG